MLHTLYHSSTGKVTIALPADDLSGEALRRCGMPVCLTAVSRHY
jgi:hypothetical protein